jgi:hypothetical protein
LDFFCGSTKSPDLANELIFKRTTPPVPPDPACEGDSDGDSDTNIGDAVHLIVYVFSGGDEPCCP